MEQTYATACARATARGTATARRDSLPALLADQVTIKGVQTKKSQVRVRKADISMLTVVTGFRKNQSREVGRLVIGWGTKEDCKAYDKEQPAKLSRPAAIPKSIRGFCSDNHTLERCQPCALSTYR